MKELQEFINSLSICKYNGTQLNKIAVFEAEKVVNDFIALNYDKITKRKYFFIRYNHQSCSFNIDSKFTEEMIIHYPEKLI